MSDSDPTQTGAVSLPELAATGAPRGAEATIDAAWEALEGVRDPELCLDVVSLGLVYGVFESEGTVVVEMTLTTPGCPVSESLAEHARAAVEEAVGAPVPVEVRLVWEPPWDPAMMDEEAAGALGFRMRMTARPRRGPDRG